MSELALRQSESNPVGSRSDETLVVSALESLYGGQIIRIVSVDKPNINLKWKMVREGVGGGGGGRGLGKDLPSGRTCPTRSHGPCM